MEKRHLALLGEMVEYMKDPEEFTRSRHEKHGGTFKTNVLLRPVVFLQPTPENIKFIYSNRDLGWADFWKDVVGRTSLAMVNDPLHKRMRSVYGRAFTQAQLDRYLAVFAELTQLHLTRWTQASEPQDMRAGIKVYTFDLAQRIMIGERFSEEKTAQSSQLFDLATAGMGCMLPYHFPGSYWSKTQRARKELVDIYQEIIDRRRVALANSTPEMPCMLDMVMMDKGQDGGEPTDKELQDMCFTMIFAGHDTTLATAQNVLHYLKAEPGMEDELRAEVDAAWDGRAPVSRGLLQALPKCRAFVVEVLRQTPPVGAVFRLLKQDTVVDGYEVPAGFTLGLNIKAVNKRGAGDDEGSLKLSRNLDDAGRFVDRTFEASSFATFGGGSRMCIGYKFAMDELLVFVMTLLRRYTFTAESSFQAQFPFPSWKVLASFAPRGA